MKQTRDVKIVCPKCNEEIDIIFDGEYQQDYFTMKHYKVCYPCWKLLTPSEESKPEKKNQEVSR